jgi:hypothetical protein
MDDHDYRRIVVALRCAAVDREKVRLDGPGRMLHSAGVLIDQPELLLGPATGVFV